MAKTYLKPTIGGTVVDASCGSGLFSRLFVKSGLYSLVVALDFSENMLKQCSEYIKQENISDEYGFDHWIFFSSVPTCHVLFIKLQHSVTLSCQYSCFLVLCPWLLVYSNIKCKL